MARSQTTMGLNVLCKIAESESESASARVAAVGMLLDRGWGKAPNAETGGDNDIRVTIRHLLGNEK